MDKKRILIVDDDYDLSMLIIDMLNDNGLDAVLAGSIEEAYSLLDSDRFHLILLDINLPDGTGFMLCEDIRKMSNLPVIFASARTSEDDKIIGLDMGGDDYISKPYSLKELMSRINALLRRTYGYEIQGTKYFINAGADNVIELDTATRTVKRQNRIVNLSLKEYDLLAYMVKEKGVTLSKEKLISNVWGAFSDVEPSTLTVHIRWLREKLENDPSKPTFIKTVWGIGYILEEISNEE